MLLNKHGSKEVKNKPDYFSQNSTKKQPDFMPLLDKFNIKCCEKYAGISCGKGRLL